MTTEAVLENSLAAEQTNSVLDAATAQVTAASGVPGPVRWQTRHRRRIMTTDAVVVILAGIAGYAVHAGSSAGSATVLDPVPVGAVLAGVVVWLLALRATKAYDWHLFGQGMSEYQRVFGATWKSFSVVAVVAWLAALDEARDAVFLSFVFGLVGLLMGRFVWRRRIHALRRRDECVTTVVAVGHRLQVERLIRKLASAPDHGFRVTGACVPAGETLPGESIAGVPVLGGLDRAGAIANEVGAGAVAVSSSHEITSEDVRRLGWNLEERGIDLMLTADLADVALPRISVSPAPGMSLLHVDLPTFSGPKYVVKQLMDRTLGLALALLATPVIAVLALAVVVTSRGPAFYLSRRVGQDGREFPMLKLRTMRQGAARMVPALADSDEGAGLLFKMRYDPRVTRIGRVLRRYSLDELPQLFNVVAGHMSLVGPRPALPHEVAAYSDRVRRRLLVKPGMTGLWQVRGRSDLSWDESVRWDVYYAENWTPQLDLLILAETARAVVTARGAY